MERSCGFSFMALEPADQAPESRSARIHPHNASTPQKSISGQLGAIPFKNYLSNCGIVAIGLTVDARWTASSTMTISAASRDVESKELQNADLQFGPLSH
jgi:hypothetical protein